MYEYRRLTPAQRIEVVQQRLAQGYPPHSPPHPIRDQLFYLLTASCYEHQPHMRCEKRRKQVLDLLFEQFIAWGMELRGWVILPNHYHLLVYVNDFDQIGRILRSIHGSMSRQWNLEDKAVGRKVWYYYSDRAIRSERHYYTTLNYIHYNPVKHSWSDSPYDWSCSSVHWYLEHQGREWLRDSWVRYPVRNYGKEWDDFAKVEDASR
ncbi:REP-associated tyrosine transposase [Allocoleopsis franciscana]|uniref:Transposase n=1 Tax=Allocoleopsis franciscana PCC 7113 TaxID=1173027 RepID=K9WJ66_9CYAN|nr:transposase [Allocoleopsis franciscana]AFZ19856.1 transposase [Allocoleopsis franciscana PCC 7113]